MKYNFIKQTLNNKVVPLIVIQAVVVVVVVVGVLAIYWVHILLCCYTASVVYRAAATLDAGSHLSLSSAAFSASSSFCRAVANLS